jgi:arylsulfatase A-like enzyme
VNVPLIISNPVLFPEARSSEALVSHIDLAPTLQDLLGGKGPKDRFEGISYAPIIFNQSKSVQDYIIFTMDDYQIGQS